MAFRYNLIVDATNKKNKERPNFQSTDSHQTSDEEVPVKVQAKRMAPTSTYSVMCYSAECKIMVINCADYYKLFNRNYAQIETSLDEKNTLHEKRLA